MSDKSSITYKEWRAQKDRELANELADAEEFEVKVETEPGGLYDIQPSKFEAPLTRKEWDARWLHQYNLYRNNQGHNHARAKRYADEVTQRRHGPRPEGSPSAVGLAWRIFWLVKVKGMDWKKLLLGAGGAFIASAGAVYGTLAADGMAAGEWHAVLAAGIVAVGVFLKEPNKKGFAHPTKKQTQ